MSQLLYGRRPVYESLRANRRRHSKLLLAENIKQTILLDDILKLAEKRNLTIERLPRDRLNQQAKGHNHQGLLLHTSDYPYLELHDILNIATQRDEPPLILLLDLLQDVQNVGTLIRSADAVGAHGIILQERRSASITPAVVSASSGAVEHLAVARVTNLVRAMQTLRESEVWLAGLHMEDTEDGTTIRYDQANLKGSIALVVGSESDGLRRLVRETCDFLISLPMRGQVASLNAATAGSLALYATWQARNYS